jgi:hypothetical protein
MFLGPERGRGASGCGRFAWSGNALLELLFRDVWVVCLRWPQCEARTRGQDRPCGCREDLAFATGSQFLVGDIPEASDIG